MRISEEVQGQLFHGFAYKCVKIKCLRWIQFKYQIFSMHQEMQLIQGVIFQAAMSDLQVFKERERSLEHTCGEQSQYISREWECASPIETTPEHWTVIHPKYRARQTMQLVVEISELGFSKSYPPLTPFPSDKAGPEQSAPLLGSHSHFVVRLEPVLRQCCLHWILKIAAVFQFLWGVHFFQCAMLITSSNTASGMIQF